MEEGDKNKMVDTSSRRSGAPLNSRWNPTKEQISMLESFYSQGIRTPTAEQIQHITARLKAYGQIEGKNVFYWFQNHKARQRQKQKQENLAYINRHYLHNTRPIFPPPPCPNVACSPYYLAPQTELGYHPQYQKPLPPGGLRRRPRTEKMEKMKSVCTSTGYQPAQNGYDQYDAMSMYPSGCLDVSMTNTRSNSCQETLPLFPLQPTGILQGKEEASCSENFVTPASSESTSMEEKPGSQTFYDFFSGHGSCESE